MSSRCTLVLLGWLVLNGLLQAGDLRSFSEVDYIVGQNRPRFAALWEQAKTQTVRIALLGDSQETAPGGGGAVYIPRLNYEFYKHFGNVPETMVEPLASTTGAWLAQYALPEPQPAGRISADQVLPQLRCFGFSTKNGNANVTKRNYGLLAMLQPDAANVVSGAELAGQAMFFDISGDIRAEVFAVSHPDSGEIAYRVLPNATPAPNFFLPVVAQGTLDLALNRSEGIIKSGKIGPLDFNGCRYMQIELNGTDDNKVTDILAMRFVNESKPAGVVVTDLAAGGYKATDFINGHGNSGAMFAALGFTAAIIHVGANDTKIGGAADYKAHIETLIAWVRKAMNDPEFRIILLSDPDMAIGPADSAKRREYDMHPGAHEAIALVDPNVLMVNSRRLAHDRGWVVGDPRFTTYVLDGVHYTELGGRVLAEVEATALLGIGMQPQPKAP